MKNTTLRKDLNVVAQVSKLLLFLVIGSCASYTDQTREMRDLYSRHNYKETLKFVSENDTLKKSQNRLLLKLEEATVLDRLTDYDFSRKKFLEADKIVDELYTESISKGALSFIYNDTVQDYPGEDYEKVAIHTMLALSFLSTNDLGAARVEARKINSRLAEINNFYDENKNKYNEDAFARYLAALIYDAKNEYDSAIIDYAKALSLYEGDFKLFNDGKIPDALVERLAALYIARNRTDQLKKLEAKYPKAVKNAREYALKNYGFIVAIHDAGVISPKEGKDFFLPISGQVIRFSFPVISNRVNSVSTTSLEVDRNNFNADQLADMNDIARTTLEDKRVRITVKAGARLLVKGQITQQAYKNFGLLGGIAANVYSAASETADTRSWALLPQAFYVSFAPVSAGVHNIVVRTNGKVSEARKVNISPKEIMILRSSG